MSPQMQKSHPYFHSLYEILFVKHGTADFIVRGKQYHLRAGSLLFISNLENHSISAHSTAYSRYSVRVSNKFITTYIKSPELLSVFNQRPADFCHQYNCTAQQQEYFADIFHIMNKEHNERKDYWDSMVAGKIYDMLVLLYRSAPRMFPASNSKAGQSTIFEIQNYIVSHIGEDLTLTEIADRFYINKFHLSHIFKEITGYNLKEYIVLERISRAKDMLLNSSSSVADISESLGFNNTSHFIRTFKSMEKLPPNQYRKKAAMR
jgi:AraC-like DNA-binding protein